MAKHLLLISFLPPSQGTGSPIILWRHLTQLEAQGWKISIIAPEQQLRAIAPFPSTWQVIPLVGRRWWWPPLRQQIPGLLKLRLALWQSDCDRYFRHEKPSQILTFLCKTPPLLAANLAKSWQVPLSVIIHDQEEFWATSESDRRWIRRSAKQVLDRATRILPVSQELGQAYPLQNPQKCSVLYPISEPISCGQVEWNPQFQTHPVIAHAGRLHPFQIPNFQRLAQALQKVNGTLLVVAPKDNPTLVQLMQTCPNIQAQEPFEQNRQVVEFLAEKASCILVSYSFSLAEQPWAATSFPSKLVEFCQLGLPLLILAPPKTAAAAWAEQQQWIGHIDRLDQAQFTQAVAQLVTQETWLQMANQTRQAAATEFDCDRIQAQFESELMKTALEPSIPSQFSATTYRTT
ncbi:MAG: glycosyltransferase family 4 protein [Oscillatoriophycideae cyanobacterium NC_groundwater_1537_Pr4_S-0.65um_50_18]|nr:glycosyltransferase family 4 protein [Oscillatoriophycideae cyanobacterium NC_groundwater_1537_Pr4_S-0.65um_50_18]